MLDIPISWRAMPIVHFKDHLDESGSGPRIPQHKEWLHDLGFQNFRVLSPVARHLKAFDHHAPDLIHSLTMLRSLDRSKGIEQADQIIKAFPDIGAGIAAKPAFTDRRQEYLVRIKRPPGFSTRLVQIHILAQLHAVPPLP